MNGTESNNRRERNGKILALFPLYILFGSHNSAYANHFLSKDADILFFVPTPYPVCADLQFQHLRIDRSIDDFYYTRSFILSGGNIVAKKRVILKNIPALAAMGRAALSSGAARCSSILPFTVAGSPRLCPGTSRALPGDMLLCFYALTP